MYFVHNPEVRYLESFQGHEMMVWAAVVVRVVEGRVGGRFN